MRCLGLALAAATGLLAAVGWCAAAPAAEPRTGGGIGFLAGDGGTSSREARESARRALAVERLPAADRQEAERVLRRPTLFRRLPTETFTCDRDLLEFALAKPDVIVDLWRVLGISRLSLDPTGPGQWKMSDGWGTEGTLRVLRHDRTPQGGTLVLLGRGGYNGPLAPQPLTGTCLVLVRYRETAREADGSARHAMQVDAFLDADGLGLEIVTRSLQGLVCRSSASNLHEICLFMAEFSATAEENPAGVARLATRLSRVDAADRAALVALVQGPEGSGEAATDPRVQAKLAARWSQDAAEATALPR